MSLPDGLHIATVVSVWTGATVGGVPMTRLRLAFDGEADVLQHTLSGGQADAVCRAIDVKHPRALQDTRWIVQVKGVEVELVRPA
jgi:hypothetical protein